MNRFPLPLTLVALCLLCSLIDPSSLLAQESLTILPNGNVGVGTTSPGEVLHIVRADGAQVLVEDVAGTGAPRTLFELVNNGRVRFVLTNDQSATRWSFENSFNGFVISMLGTGGQEFRVDGGGDLFLTGVVHENSDRAVKRDISPVEGSGVLRRLDELPISTWRYRADVKGALHMGPMAQDFHAAFGLGTDERHVASLDLAGVALAAVKELRGELARRDREIEDLRRELRSLAAQIHDSTPEH